MPRCSASHCPSRLVRQSGSSVNSGALARSSKLTSASSPRACPAGAASVLLVGVPCGSSARPVRLSRWCSSSVSRPSRALSASSLSAQADDEHAVEAVRLAVAERHADAHADVDGLVEVDHPAHRLRDHDVAVVGLELLVGRRRRVRAGDQRRPHGPAELDVRRPVAGVAEEHEAVGEHRRPRGARPRAGLVAMVRRRRELDERRVLGTVTSARLVERCGDRPARRRLDRGARRLGAALPPSATPHRLPERGYGAARPGRGASVAIDEHDVGRVVLVVGSSPGSRAGTAGRSTAPARTRARRPARATRRAPGPRRRRPRQIAIQYGRAFSTSVSDSVPRSVSIEQSSG